MIIRRLPLAVKTQPTLPPASTVSRVACKLGRDHNAVFRQFIFVIGLKIVILELIIHLILQIRLRIAAVLDSIHRRQPYEIVDSPTPRLHSHCG